MTLSYSFKEQLSKRHVRKYAEAPTGCGVLVVDDGKLLVGTRADGKDKGLTCGPGGHIEQGEAPSEAARREAYEEFNIICDEMRFLDVMDGGKYGKSAVFLCESFHGSPKTDEKEMTDLRWESPKNLGENLFPPFEQSLKLLPVEVLKFNPYHGADGRFTTGSGATSFTIRTKDSSKQKMVGSAVVREAADQIRNLDHEELVVIDSDGRMNHYAVGDEGEVRTTVGAMREHATGAVIMHNHPSGGTFSPQDLHQLGYRPSEIRIATADGDYVMRSADGTVPHWPKLQDAILNAEWDDFKEPYQLRNEIYEQKYKASYDAEVTSIADRWIKQRNEGASQETLDATLKEWEKADKKWRKKHPKKEREAEAERAYREQYHKFYMEHAAEYGIDYSFEPKIKKYNHNHGADGRFTTGSGLSEYGGMIRKDPPPKNARTGYKAFVVKDGKLYPPMVANPNGVDTPIGVWLDAQEGERAGESKTGRPQVKSGGKGTKGGSGKLAYRPGWHLGDIPLATQFYTTNKETGEREMYPNLVFAECKFDADHDYQSEAMSYGYNSNGKFQHSLAGLPKIPKGGCYTYRTNPNPNTRPWYISGSMKVERILTDAEASKIIREAGETPMKRKGGELTQEKLDELMGEVKKYNHNHDPATGRFTSGSSIQRGERGHVSWTNMGEAADVVGIENIQKYGLSKALIMHDIGCSEKKAEEYHDAIWKWSVSSVDIRAAQNGHAEDAWFTSPEEAEKLSKDLERFIDLAPQWNGGTLYRGIEMEDYNGYPIHDYSFLQEGDVIDMGGTSSWSSNKDIANEFTSRRFTGDAILFVTDDIGKATSIMPHSTLPVQEEVLASKDNKYTIDSIREYKNGWMSVREMHITSTDGKSSEEKQYHDYDTSKVDDFVHLMLGDVKKFNMFHGKDGRFTYSPYKTVYSTYAHDGKYEGGHNRPKVSNENPTEQRRLEGASFGRIGGKNKRGHLELADGHHVKDPDGSIVFGQDVIQREMGCSEEQARKYALAVDGFTDSVTTCSNIRRWQRGEFLETGFQYKLYEETAKNLDEYLENAPQWNGGPIYRGISFDEKKFYANVGVGDVIDMGGASSWSSERSVAENYASHGEIFVVDNPTKGTSTRHLSSFPMENEVTVSSKVTYRVTSVEYTKLGTKITHLAQCRLPVTDGVSKNNRYRVDSIDENEVRVSAVE